MFPGKTSPIKFPNRMGRKVGSAWEIFAPAKLNLYLEVLGQRADGYHALETLMVPVRIYDRLVWRDDNDSITGDRLSLTIRNQFDQGDCNDRLLGEVDDNLVLRAARLLGKAAGIAPYGRFELIKRIPIQAGMGGGSSDAAAALLLANKAWDLNYTSKELMPLAAQLGSDVPFFLNHGAAVCRGRGEQIEPVARLPKLHFVVVKPTFSLSTAEVFGQMTVREETCEELASVSRSSLSKLLAALRCGDLRSAGLTMANRLEMAAARLTPKLQQLRKVFSGMNFPACFMTGSGSAFVGLMRSAVQARYCAGRLAGMNLGNVFATSSC